MTETTIGELTALIAVVVAIATAYGKAFGRSQMQLVQWTIEALIVPNRYRGLLNLAIGVSLALLMSGIAAWIIGEPRFIAIGLLAGIIASIEAGNSHDATRSDQKPAISID
ncbi:hypothetical protein BH09CHL1_BH09CHL1_25650 [soil metagenome]